MGDTIKVVGKIFAILEYMSQSNEAKGPTDVAAATGLNKSTVYRLLSSMAAQGYVEKNADGTYNIGIKLVEIISTYINNLELQTEARPFLNELHNELGLIVHLGILDNAEVIYVEKVDIVRNIRLYAQIGMRVPAYCSSLGKCMLACLSGDELEYLLSQSKLKRYTPNTITSVRELKAHLREVRYQGWAMDNEEYIIGNRCIGAPVYDYRGEIIAAVSASGPVSLVSDERVPEIISRVCQTASQISRRLCYRVS
ncbi:MAG: IclR family transcriptional regulator [Oscillospiraceae bacterium]|nr:IclR family transcriptional regulator [Oscillospiraceae bacterium]